MIKLVFLLFGLLTVGGIIWHIGPDLILNTIQQLGPVALGFILFPLVTVYVLEAYGWHVTLGAVLARRVGFIRLFGIRMAGEVINMTTPTAYVGGEPMKAYLLRRFGVPMVDGMASVVTAKTTMTLAQVLFILMGIGLMFGLVGSSRDSVFAALISVGLLAFGVVLFVVAQRYGMAYGLLKAVRKTGIYLPFLEHREAELRSLDETIRRFYVERRAAFYLAVTIYLVAWMIETFEVYAILYFLNVPVDLLSAFSIAALSVLIKGGTFFIPGSLGAQEGGYLLLLMGFGYDQVTGITFALIRRLREILWIGLGLIFLMALKSDREMTSAQEST